MKLCHQIFRLLHLHTVNHNTEQVAHIIFSKIHEISLNFRKKIHLSKRVEDEPFIRLFKAMSFPYLTGT